jgi:peptidoglycan hydrolase-like protein with peptidoglycan-binding domain
MNLDLPILLLGTNRCEVIAVKALLDKMGYSIPIFDQFFGRATEYALQKFQKDQGMEPTGICDEATWLALIRGKHYEEKKH